MGFISTSEAIFTYLNTLVCAKIHPIWDDASHLLNRSRSNFADVFLSYICYFAPNTVVGDLRIDWWGLIVLIKWYIFYADHQEEIWVYLIFFCVLQKIAQRHKTLLLTTKTKPPITFHLVAKCWTLFLSYCSAMIPCFCFWISQKKGFTYKILKYYLLTVSQ